uniref:Subunit 5 of NADH-plastoquinone oxidoreductase n=1 Tax=Entransia fimbriata TaxID=130991 RepID=A0A191T4Q0_9VIRI|nr:subunit 5 of NADH-plastoquinone oxidoreductase [Entransia fimbriata]ANI25362.1 subunit 5 of NADH-plastoquinone oxidoreductase [Entransia fimbriata]WKT05711.1 subunit 5 of NADH-plastoquinone oxidoreductase [Entransia fimbriata]WKT05830.1 subunit 5 of NADH-plastoquinone oxidoreductase [Entransia fimbriata]
MIESVYEHIWLVPMLPFFAAILVGINLIGFRYVAQSIYNWHNIYILVSMFISMILSIILLLNQIQNLHTYKFLLQWMLTRDFQLEIGFLIDSLTTVMLIVVTTIAFLVMIYSNEYMFYDQGYVRFLVYLSLFTASMLGLVMSPNLIQIYIFWELVGMCSYLLIGFWATRPSAAQACQKAFIANRIGDFGLLLGILGFYWITGSFEFQIIAERLHILILNNRIHLFFPILCSILLFLGPIAKSAQFPLHIWLPDAMEGPTPISALIHAATMVAAGVFLVARLFPIFSQLDLVMNIIAWTGGLTAILGASIALTQIDLKKALAYSTISQLGYMIMAIGLGSYTAGLFHLVTHAYSKALLFLGAGSVIHSMESIIGWNPIYTQNMFLMGGLRKYMPITTITFLIGTLSICGIPPFSCFWSKDAILSAAWHNNLFLWGITWLTAGLTGFYMFRIYLLTFEGFFLFNKNKESILDKDIFVNDEKLIKNNILPHESGPYITLSLILLVIPTIFIGFLESPFANFFGQWLGDAKTETLNFMEFIPSSSSSIGIAFLGITISILTYFIPIIPMNILVQRANLYYKASYSRWYIDNLYDNTWIQWNRCFAYSTLRIDKWWIDSTINGLGVLSIFAGENVKYWETGLVQNYLFTIVISMASFLLFAVVTANVFY